MATRKYVKRLQREYLLIQKNPPPYIDAAPLPENILEWHYCLSGLEDCPYSGGYYHGKLVFPPEYPMKPPAIYMITPNGRFHTNTRLCLSISDFHPDQWNPSWTVEGILKGLLSFMLSDDSTAGSMQSTTEQKKSFAAKSLLANLRDDTFVRLFPEKAEEMRDLLRRKRAELGAKGNLSGDASNSDSGAAVNGATGRTIGLAMAVLVPVFAYVVHAVLSSQ